jgi:hypothetical protein
MPPSAAEKTLEDVSVLLVLLKDESVREVSATPTVNAMVIATTTNRSACPFCWVGLLNFI